MPTLRASSAWLRPAASIRSLTRSPTIMGRNSIVSPIAFHEGRAIGRSIGKPIESLIIMSADAHSEPSFEALKRAVTVLGGQSAMARLIGVTQPTVWAWLDRAKPLPAEHVLKVEEATGISRHDLRPDLYPREATPAPQGDDDRLEGVRP